MAKYVGLLRAVNVGGTGKLPMAELRALAEGLGFARVRTLLASGNLLVDSALGRGTTFTVRLPITAPAAGAD